MSGGGVKPPLRPFFRSLPEPDMTPEVKFTVNPRCIEGTCAGLDLSPSK